MDSSAIGPRAAAALPYFLYGTLVDRDLLARVSGDAIGSLRVEGASMVGWRRTGVVDRTYPCLVRQPRGQVDGILVYGLSAAARARLDEYEGVNYRLIRAIVANRHGNPVAVAMYEFVGFASGLRSDRRLWHLTTWQRRWKRRALRRASRLRPSRGLPQTARIRR